MNSTRNYQQNTEGRWFYQETETYSNGNVYINYYCQRIPNPDFKRGGYQSTTQTDWCQQTFID